MQTISRISLLFNETANPVGNLIADFPKDGHLLVISPLGLRRIFKAPMEQGGCTWKGWTSLRGVIAYGDHIIEVLAKIWIDAF